MINLKINLCVLFFAHLLAVINFVGMSSLKLGGANV